MLYWCTYSMRAHKKGFWFFWHGMLWALLRSVKHHIKTNQHLTVSGEFHDTSSQAFYPPLMFSLAIPSQTTAPATMSLLAHAVNRNARRGIAFTSTWECQRGDETPCWWWSCRSTHRRYLRSKDKSLDNFDRLSSDQKWNSTQWPQRRVRNDWLNYLLAKEANNFWLSLYLLSSAVMKENSRPLTITYEFPQLSFCLHPKKSY